LKLLIRNEPLRVHKWQTGGPAVKGRVPVTVTPVQCLSYALSQAGICSAVTGVTNLEELDGCLRYFDASREERDYSALLQEFQGSPEGQCIYCDHCLPCPVGIEIGQVIRLLETASGGITGRLRAAYQQLGDGAHECTRCGECLDRCPFGVDIVAKMDEAAATFRH
jgi:predicted aldo/keto reductase-like oxidoreductase